MFFYASNDDSNRLPDAFTGSSPIRSASECSCSTYHILASRNQRDISSQSARETVVFLSIWHQEKCMDFMPVILFKSLYSWLSRQWKHTLNHLSQSLFKWMLYSLGEWKPYSLRQSTPFYAIWRWKRPETSPNFLPFFRTGQATVEKIAKISDI